MEIAETVKIVSDSYINSSKRAKGCHTDGKSSVWQFLIILISLYIKLIIEFYLKYVKFERINYSKNLYRM